MRTSILLFFLLGLQNLLSAQNHQITGMVLDQNDNPLPGATVEIFAENNRRIAATTTDHVGKYFLEVEPDDQPQNTTIVVKFLGMETVRKPLALTTNKKIEHSFKLKESHAALPGVVVSASKTAQRMEETTVSVSIMTPDLVINKNPTDLQQTVDQMPGVNVTEGQVNIRSGSGWSYGAGTRVLTLVDDLPLISPDANQVLWPIIPFESIDQVEIIKGASSALYGSAALNGVLNVRTRSPFSKHTSANLFAGFYDAPAREELHWYRGNTQLIQGAQFSHSNFFKLGKGKFGYLLGANQLNDQGYAWRSHDQRARIHWKTAYKIPLSKNNLLEFGLNGTFSHRNSGQALIWNGTNQGYIAFDSSVTTTTGITYFLDPYISLHFNKGKIKHHGKMQGRFLNIDNVSADEVNSFDNASRSALLQYQHQATYKKAVFTGGLFGLTASTNSQIFGNHNSSNQAVFIQADVPYKRFKFSGGARYEAFRVDEMEEARPVFRAGVNYMLMAHTNLYTSYGQGFRFPSIAELFTQTNVGMINIFPAGELRPELGQTFELGIKQNIGIGEVLKSRLEVAGYIMHFDEMIEFTFNNWGNSGGGFNLDDLGFRSINIGEVMISGIEVNYTGVVNYRKTEWQFLAGYTYANPVVRDPEANILSEPNPRNYIDLSSDTTNTLKYRFRHLAKADLQCIISEKYRIGGSLRYNSFMQAIDLFFNSINGVRNFREENNSGDFFVDLRIGYVIHKNLTVNIICDNVFNREYMIRPAMLGMPRRYMLQLNARF
ncbi:MAG: TonB-dependent receptor [Cryomorphaceae bacterium]|nr:TonB-dependent receptor [Cryomorphaceae bacterium]